MKRPALGTEVALALCKVLHLDPSGVRRIRVDLRPGAFATVEVSRLVEGDQAGELIDEIRLERLAIDMPAPTPARDPIAEDLRREWYRRLDIQRGFPSSLSRTSPLPQPGRPVGSESMTSLEPLEVNR